MGDEATTARCLQKRPNHLQHSNSTDGHQANAKGAAAEAETPAATEAKTEATRATTTASTAAEPVPYGASASTGPSTGPETTDKGKAAAITPPAVSALKPSAAATTATVVAVETDHLAMVRLAV